MKSIGYFFIMNQASYLRDEGKRLFQKQLDMIFCYIIKTQNI